MTYWRMGPGIYVRRPSGIYVPPPDPEPPPDPPPNPDPGGGGDPGDGTYPISPPYDDPPDSAAAVTVSNAAALNSALASASPGDLILCEDGDYDAVNFSDRVYTGRVYVRARNRYGAVVNGTKWIEDSKNLSIDGFKFFSNAAATRVVVAACEGVILRNCDIGGSVQVNDAPYALQARDHCQDCHFIANYLHHCKYGCFINNFHDGTFTDNIANYIGQDSFHFSGVHGLLVARNIMARIVNLVYPGAHADGMQFAAEQQNSSRIQVVHNVLLGENNGVQQGPFMKGEANDVPTGRVDFEDIYIAHNIISTAMGNHIKVQGVANRNVTIEYNTCLHYRSGQPNASTKEAGLIIQGGQQNMIMRKNIQSSETKAGGTFGDGNLRLTYSSGDGQYYVGSNFQTGILNSIGKTVAMFEPQAGSLAAGDVGAKNNYHLQLALA